MFNFQTFQRPATLIAMQERTIALGFDACSDERTGRLLAWLAGLKPRGCVLDLGTGTGMSAAWLLLGMDDASHLLSVDNDDAAQGVARDLLGDDQRATFILSDSGPFLQATESDSFDLIFADAWPGKYSHLDEALRLLKPHGVYIVDDLLPQPNWPPDHQPNVDRLVSELERNPALDAIRLDWSTGIMIVTKRAQTRALGQVPAKSSRT